MKNLGLPSRKNAKLPQPWLLILTAIVIAIHLGLIIKRVAEPGNINLLGTGLLSWGVLLFLLWSNRSSLQNQPSKSSIFLGLLIFSIVLPISVVLHNSATWLQVIPLISFLGFIVLAFDLKGLKQHTKELILIAILAIPETIIVTKLSNTLPPLSAKCASFVLAHLGFNVINEGIHVILPTGGVDVDQGCSGAVAMFQLFRIALLFLIFFPTHLTRHLISKILVTLIAISIAFIINGFRIALLAFLSASSYEKAFDYWHTGEGSHIFSLTSVIIFGSFCYFLISQDKSENQKPRRLEK